VATILFSSENFTQSAPRCGMNLGGLEQLLYFAPSPIGATPLKTNYVNLVHGGISSTK